MPHMTDNLPELPPEVLADLQRDRTVEQTHESAERAWLKSFAQVICKLRDDAVMARQRSGLETLWKDCEEAYLGIDEMNRDQFAAARWIKPTSMEGPVMVADQAKSMTAVRSTVLPRITARYVDVGAAKVSEILLPIDDKAFSLTSTPLPVLIKGKEDRTAVMLNGVPLTRPAQSHELMAPPAPYTATMNRTMPEMPLTTQDLVEEAIQRATEKAKRAERRIYDWLVESNFAAEMRKVIFDAARLGVGVLKGPFPERVRAQSLSTVPGPGGRPQLTMEFIEQIKPRCAWLDPWNFFPDSACGENPHTGDTCFERAYFSPKQVRLLKDQPGYHSDLIDEILKEGPKDTTKTSRNPHEETEQDRYEGWYCYVSIPRADLFRMNPESAKHTKEEDEWVYAIVTLINDIPVYATLHPLDSGDLPYHVIPWRRRPGSWAGVGVTEQMMVPARLITSAERAMLNNAGRAGSQIVVNRGLVEPMDEEWTVYADKIWAVKESGGEVGRAFTVYEIPNHTREYMSIIEHGLRLAEESTSIPLITQGQSGQTSPETYGATALQNTNANQLLRSIANAFDDYITKPVVTQYYEWLLLDPDVPEEEKGDFQIQAHGSSALVERAIQEQEIAQMGELVIKGWQVFGIDPKKWFAAKMKARRLNPMDFQFTEEEQAKLAQQPPPTPLAVQVAQIRAQTEVELAKLDAGLEQQKIQLDLQLAGAKTGHDRAILQLEMQMLEMKRELAIMDYSARRGIAIDHVKARLAEAAMKLTTQKELAAAGNTRGRRSPQVAVPPMEPVGRAPVGQAYAQ